MDSASALAHLETLQRLLDKVVEGIRLIEAGDWDAKTGEASPSEALKAAARDFAATATEAARDAVQICIRLDALPPAREPERRSRKLSN
jgi:hypothetical protein